MRSSQYASQVNTQLTAGNSSDMVDLALSIVKPLDAQWLHDLYDCMLARPKIIMNGFRQAGLLDTVHTHNVCMP